MKVFTSFLIVFIVVATKVLGQYTYVEELTIESRNKVFYKGQHIGKSRELKSIIEEKQNTQLNSLFRKYRRKRFAQQAFARIRDFGLFHAVFTVAGYTEVRYLPSGMAIVGIGGAEILRKPSQRALKELVEAYNDVAVYEEVQRQRALSRVRQ